MSKKSNYYAMCIIFTIFILHSFCNFILIQKDSVPLYFDEGGYHLLSLDYYRYLFSDLNINRIYQHFYSISNFYPPLVFIERMPFYIFLGVSEKVSILANLPFLFILIYFVFLLGRDIYDAKTGVLAAFLVSFYPAIYGFSRTNFVTIPMAAAVAMSLYLLLRSRGFSSRKYSILFGLSVGLGMLTKWMHVFYIFTPVILCLFRPLEGDKKISLPIKFKNLILAAVPALLLAGPWYLPHIRNIIPMVFSVGYENPNWIEYTRYLASNPFQWGLIKYIMIMEQYQLYSFYTILFIYGLFRLFVFEDRRMKWFLGLSLAVPYILFSLCIIELYSGELCPRYIVPLYSLAAIITARGIIAIKGAVLRRFLIFSVILVGLWQCGWTAYKKSGESYSMRDFQERTTRGSLSAKKVDWHIDEITSTIETSRAPYFPNVLIIPHTPMTSALGYALQAKRDCNLVFLLDATFKGNKYALANPSEYDELLDSADFVLTQIGGKLTYDESPWIKDSLKIIKDQFQNRIKEFKLLKDFKIEMDNETMHFFVYKRKGKEVESLEPQGEGVSVSGTGFIKGNLTYNTGFGLTIDGGSSPAYAVYEVVIPHDGDYELWVRYATMENRPVDISFDGRIIETGGLVVFTKGWSYADAPWFKEADIQEVKHGRHLLKFIAHHTPFPHLAGFKLIYRPKGGMVK